MSNNKTKFGYEDVTIDEKSEMVDEVFHSVADVYDDMNDAMSFGIHRFWKIQAASALDLHQNDIVADIACGTGDNSQLILKEIPHGELFCIDPNSAMLNICKQRLQSDIPITFLETKAEDLDFNQKFDKINISFGLRNFSDPELGLKQIFKATQIGGKIVIMEFNPPKSSAFSSQYELYLKYIVPCLGKYIGQDESSYQYLADSIALQPTPEERIKQLEAAGFEFVKHSPMTMGVVGLFEAYRCR